MVASISDFLASRSASSHRGRIAEPTIAWLKLRGSERRPNWRPTRSQHIAAVLNNRGRRDKPGDDSSEVIQVDISEFLAELGSGR
jgi:hypothetical protein